MQITGKLILNQIKDVSWTFPRGYTEKTTQMLEEIQTPNEGEKPESKIKTSP